VQRHVEDPLAEELIRGRLPLGGVEVYVDGGRLAYRPAARSESGQRLAQNV
jgi:RNase P/RNase MRP subunit p29